MTKKCQHLLRASCKSPHCWRLQTIDLQLNLFNRVAIRWKNEFNNKFKWAIYAVFIVFIVKSELDAHSFILYATRRSKFSECNAVDAFQSMSQFSRLNSVRALTLPLSLSLSISGSFSRESSSHTVEVHEKSPSLQTTDVKRKYLLMRSVSDKREGNKQTEHRRLLASLCHDHLQGIEGVWGEWGVEGKDTLKRERDESNGFLRASLVFSRQWQTRQRQRDRSQSSSYSSHLCAAPPSKLCSFDVCFFVYPAKKVEFPVFHSLWQASNQASLGFRTRAIKLCFRIRKRRWFLNY